MQDLMARGEAWFDQQRREHLATLVEYRPAGGIPRFCRATLVIGRWEKMDSTGQIVRIETRDFFIGRDELPQDPRRGDTIVLTEDGTDRTYEVAIPDGSDAPWRWADRLQKVRRIHTMAKSATPAASPAALLVRYVGASQAASITDAQIVSQLSGDMATGLGIARTIEADASYLYVVVPTSWVEEEPQFRVNGLSTNAFQSSTRSITLPGQAARSYTIFRSVYAVTGTINLEVA